MTRQSIISGGLLAGAAMIGGILSWGERPPPDPALPATAPAVLQQRANSAALFDAMRADQQTAVPVSLAVAAPQPQTQTADWSPEVPPAATVALFEAMRADLELAAMTSRRPATLFEAMRADLETARFARISRPRRPETPARLPKFDLLGMKTQELVAPEDCGCDRDPKLGTALTWTNSLDEAKARAEKEGKLVFLIHVSGNFAIPGFT